MKLDENIRFAELTDCEAILDIYKPYITDTSITFETEVPSLNEFKDRFHEITAQYPWLVFEENQKVLGYAYACNHRKRAAYNWSCEVAVYIDKNHHKKGIGSRLYKNLFPILKEQGYFSLFAGVTQPNEGSNKIHQRMGFEKIGTYKRIGFKQDSWHDVSWFQLEINSGNAPKDPINIHTLKEQLK